MIKALWNVSLRLRARRETELERREFDEQVNVFAAEFRSYRKSAFSQNDFMHQSRARHVFAPRRRSMKKYSLDSCASLKSKKKKTLCFTFSLPSVLNVFAVVNSLVKWLHCQAGRRMRYVSSRTVLFHVTPRETDENVVSLFFCWSNSMCWLWQSAESIWVCKFWYRFK